MTRDRWEWFGTAGHFICASHCRFHLCTLVGDYLVSTVGQYVPPETVREILATSRGMPLEGRGDAREYDWMTKFGYEDIGYNRKYETMVFKAGKRCDDPDCNCGQPAIDGPELEMNAYQNAGDATRGHLAICERLANK